MRWEWLALLVGLGATALGCLLPMRLLPVLPNDKLLHFAAFLVLALLAGRLAPPGTGRVLALAAVFAISWAIEIGQNFVPGRRFCWRDLAANAAGVGCAALILAVTLPLA